MAATEALVFDAVRTPRGRGKVNGSLHATKPVDLVVGLMHETLARNGELDPSRTGRGGSAAAPGRARCRSGRCARSSRPGPSARPG